MADGKKKMICKETGTVPKVKYWKNTGPQHDSNVSNNLTTSMLPIPERARTDSRNRQRCSNYHCFEGSCMEDTRIYPNYNSLPYINMSGGTTSPSTSGSTSRRHSGGAIRKCDNLTKYPDKKQIEEKLNQIREYLKVTSSLMTSVKADQSNSEETDELYQMLSALRDSEKKLEALLINREINAAGSRQETIGDVKLEMSENSVPALESESLFPTFQNNMQNNELEQKMAVSEKKLQALHDQQNLLAMLQEKAESQLKNARKVQERLAACANGFQQPVQQPSINSSQADTKNAEKNRTVELSQYSDLESQVDQLSLSQTGNESRGQLLRLLDARDNELCAEQQALQQKLAELSNKKQQIDQLMSQIHSYDTAENSDDGDDMANQIRQIVAMKEQLATLKDMLSAVKSTEAALLQQHNVERAESAEQLTATKSGNVTKSGSSVMSEPDAKSDSDRRWNTMGKLSNKSSISSSREQLQAELQAKKQELEELMYKDQDRTSAINQDVCSELVMNKSEHQFSLDSVPSSWTLLQDNTPPRDSCVSRENVYSSDEEELENYSQLNNSSKVPDYTPCNFAKPIPSRPVLNCNPTLPDSASSPSVNQNFNAQWSGVEHKQQLELMTSLCQSLLEQQRQIIPSHCSVPNFQWFSSYMQMQQALMLSTISQCCQLLWIQQQDINTLINTVSMMQQRSKPAQGIKITQPSTETCTSASACSLPTRLPSVNTEYATLSPREGVAVQNLTRNIPVGVIGQPQPVWSGAQALNNQVAPGNRANNYWDNFRSYSRQNLLSTSTKSNEGSQNSLSMIDRSNVTFSQPVGIQRSHQSTLPKINMPIHEGIPTIDPTNQESQSVVDTTASRSDRAKTAKRNRAPCRNRNEWTEDAPQTENSPQKSKLFEVLRENVYKEVTLLISANENRPHFLIQLFRDLQLISSDPLRRSALQSIQALITRSLTDNIAPSSSHNSQPPQENRTPVSSVAPPIAVTPSKNKSEKTSPRCCVQPSAAETVQNCELDPEAQRILMELLPFLKSHNEDVFHNGLLDMIKMMIFQLLPVKNSASSNKLQAKLDALLSDSLVKFKGRRIIDIKENILKAIADILLEELPVTSIAKERQNSTSESHLKPMENMSNSMLFLSENSNSVPFEPFQFLQMDQKTLPNFSNAPRIDNGDLAEADQSRREADNEEGAVGGLLLTSTDSQPTTNSANPSMNDIQSGIDMFMNSEVNFD